MKFLESFGNSVNRLKLIEIFNKNKANKDFNTANKKESNRYIEKPSREDFPG